MISDSEGDDQNDESNTQLENLGAAEFSRREVYGPHDALDLLYKAATDNSALQTPINPRVFENNSYSPPQILYAQQQQSAILSSYSMGVPHNPDQQLQGPGMPQQMHIGFSGPRPQVNQPSTMIGEMQQGVGGPRAHPLQHLVPGQAQQAQLLQQQQQMCTYAWSWCFRAFYIGLPSI